MEINSEEAYQALRTDSGARWPGPHGPEVRFASDAIEMTVLPSDGCRISTIRAFGHEVIRQWNPSLGAFEYGAFPMVPWVGRLGGGLLYSEGRVYQLPINCPPHALHGLACFGAWQQISEGTFQVELGDLWPWKARAIQRFVVEDSRLHISLIVESEGERFPAQAGWHPWFLKVLEGENSEVTLANSPAWQEDLGSNELPTGRRILPQRGPWDNCFGYDGAMKAELRWEELTMRISSERSWSTLYTEPADALCVEPLTGPPNAINLSPEFVEPGKSLEIHTTWEFISTAAGIR